MNDQISSQKNNIDIIKKIENNSIFFNNWIKKFNIYKYLGMLLLFTVFLVFFFLKFNFLILSIILASCLLSGFVVAEVFKRQKISEYLKSSFRNFNIFLFQEISTDKIQNCDDKKIDKEYFNQSNIYKDIYSIENRNFINCKISEKSVQICDCVVQKKSLNKIELLFMGKYLIIPNNYTDNNCIVIYMLNNKKTLSFSFMPNNFDHLPKQFGVSNMAIFTKNKNYKEFITNNFLKIISNFITNNFFIDITIVIQKETTCFYLGYDEYFAYWPFREKIDFQFFKNIKNDIKTVLQLASLV